LALPGLPHLEPPAMTNSSGILAIVGMEGSREDIALLQALAQAAPRGTRIVVAGVCMQTDVIEPFAFIAKEIELRFVLGYTPQEFADSLTNLAEGKTRYNEIVTGVVGLDETPAAFTALQTDKSQIKILVKP